MCYCNSFIRTGWCIHTEGRVSVTTLFFTLLRTFPNLRATTNGSSVALYIPKCIAALLLEWNRGQGLWITQLDIFCWLDHLISSTWFWHPLRRSKCKCFLYKSCFRGMQVKTEVIAQQVRPLSVWIFCDQMWSQAGLWPYLTPLNMFLSVCVCAYFCVV